MKDLRQQTVDTYNKSAKALDFIEAAKYRDELFALENVLKEK